MVIYGIALLGICTLVGLFLGEMLGLIFGINANVGGIGIAMKWLEKESFQLLLLLEEII